jgi:predicted lipoprotein with Yx(FWY)xxD motif
VVLAVTVSPALLAGCGSSSASDTPGTATTATTASSASTTPSTLGTTTTASGSTPPFYEVRTGTVHGLGTVLVDGQGMTLYLFVPDRQSGSSTCYGPCAQAWPPLDLPTGVTVPVAGAGVRSSLLGTTRRTDGTTQITYDKWPLYLWVNDSEPGQATGQGLDNLGGLWYVVSADGREITARS